MKIQLSKASVERPPYVVCSGSDARERQSAAEGAARHVKLMTQKNIEAACGIAAHHLPQTTRSCHGQSLSTGNRSTWQRPTGWLGVPSHVSRFTSVVSVCSYRPTPLRTVMGRSARPVPVCTHRHRADVLAPRLPPAPDSGHGSTRWQSRAAATTRGCGVST